jgi:SAM-dependent methyltransferase
MTTLDERSRNERLHGQYLAKSGDPEQVWNWATPAGKIRAKRRGRLIAEAADLKPTMSVLEVGCGTGLFTEILANYGSSILAIDISPDLLEIAQKRNLPRKQIEFREMRLEDGIIEDQFDAIVGSSVLHHLDTELALPHIFEMLRPGGVMVFAEPNLLNPQIWAERNIPSIRERNGVSPDETAFVRWQLARDLKRFGFCDIRIHNIDWLHPATPRWLISPVFYLGLVLEHIPLIREFSGSVLIAANRPG